MGNRDSGDEIAERPEPGQDRDHGGYDRTVFSKGQDFARPAQAGLFGDITPVPRSAEVRVLLQGAFPCVNCHSTVTHKVYLEGVARGVPCLNCGTIYTVQLRRDVTPLRWEAVEEL